MKMDDRIHGCLPVISHREDSTMKSAMKIQILEEGRKLLDTFTLSYPYGLYKDSYYSTTYDELSRWLRQTISYYKESSPLKQEDPLVVYLNSFRGKLGNIDRREFQHILTQLSETE